MCKIDDAIDYFRNQNTEAHIYCSNSKHCDKDTLEMFEMNDLAIQALKEKKQREWVKCSDRLPEAHTDVLILTNNNQFIIGRWISKGDRSWWIPCIGKWISFDDTPYWQPLPQPYKEAENE